MIISAFSGSSATLHQWQQLATPNLAGILRPRPGVLTKDFRELEGDVQTVYSLNDPEEDDLCPAPGAMGGRPLGTSYIVTLGFPLDLMLISDGKTLSLPTRRSIVHRF
ncbi:unnamed protein product [Boreogadus saida]